MCVGTCGGQKEVSDPLELELKALVNHVIWVLETEHGFSGRTARVLNC